MRTFSLFLAGLVLLGTTRLLPAAGNVQLVSDGQARALIVVPANADERTRAAAQMLSDYVKKSSGAALAIIADKAPVSVPAFPKLHIGPDEFVQSLKLGLERLDGDGFVIRGVDAKNIVIAGPTPWGTQFGVHEFLERYLGVRWLMPGPEEAVIARMPADEAP